MKQDALWQVFLTTGKVEDYLRYREAAQMTTAKEQAYGTHDKGTDHPPTQCRGS